MRLRPYLEHEVVLEEDLWLSLHCRGDKLKHSAGWGLRGNGRRWLSILRRWWLSGSGTAKIGKGGGSVDKFDQE